VWDEDDSQALAHQAQLERRQREESVFASARIAQDELLEMMREMDEMLEQTYRWKCPACEE
jgi:rubrerythrin